MKKHMKTLLCLLLAIFILVALCACGSKKDEKPESRTNQANITSLYDYARRLEEAGNSEAAAAVYALIAQGGGAELIEKAHEEFPAVKDADEIEQIEEVFDRMKGGDGK